MSASSRPASALRPAILAVLLAAACGSRADRRANAQKKAIDSLAREAAQLATGDSSPADRARVDDRVGQPQVAGAAGDSLRIVSTDGTIVYTLARDTVRMQLGDSLIRHVRHEVNTGTDSAEGNFAGFIKSTVAGAVGSAMGFVIRTPVRDIKSARYEDGELRIQSRGSGLHSGTFSVGGKQGSDHDSDHTAFSRADAERFIAAIEARQRALGVR